MDQEGQKTDDGPGGFPNWFSFGDPDVDEQMSQLARMAPAGGVILSCVFCSLFVLFSLAIAFMIWAFFTIFDSQQRYSTRCAGESPIWIFCLCAVVWGLICCFYGWAMATTRATFLKEGDFAANMFFTEIAENTPGFYIWCLLLIIPGVWIWAAMSGDCRHFYEATDPDLLLLFNIIVIISTAGICSFGIWNVWDVVSTHSNRDDHEK